MKYVSGNNIFITFETKSINMTLQKNLQNMNDIKIKCLRSESRAAAPSHSDSDG